MAAATLARTLYYAAAMILFGGTLFCHQTGRPPLRRIGAAAWITALLAALAGLSLTTAQMAGDGSAALDLSTMIQVVTATLFGQILLVRLAALALLAAFLFFRLPRLSVAAAALALAAPAVTSHAAAASPAHFAAIGIMVDGLHLLTAGYWIGGLVVLARLFARRTAPQTMLAALGIFSQTAMIAVLLLVMTGMINAAITVLGGEGTASRVYLSVLAGKLACVLAMLGLALVNRFRLMPRGDTVTIAHNAAMELALGLFVVTLAALLGQLQPTL